MKCRILLVDDEKTMVKYLSKRLIIKGFEVHKAYNGLDGLEQVRKTDFDVVLLDVLMPGMNGIDTLKEIKKIKPQTEVIILTGHASEAAGTEGMAAGAFNYILKPFDFNELVAEINSACKQHRVMKKEG